MHSLKRIVLSIAVAWLSTSTVQAATYYISPTGSDANNGTSEALAVFTSTRAAIVMAAGDTLNVVPGTYPSTQRFQLADFDKGSAWTSGNYTIIRCTVPMEAIIKNTSSVNMTGNNSWYFYVEGLVFDYVTASKEIQGHQWKFVKCGFKGGPSTGNDTNLQVGTNNFTPGASNWLLEDGYWVGYSTNSGRYQLLIYESQYGIVRRGVAWMGAGWDDGGSMNPSGNVTVYNSSYTYIQNFLVLDSTSVPDTYQAAYYRVNNTGQSFDGDRNEWWGGMARNINGFGVYYDGAAAVSSETWRHMTLVDTFSGGATFGYGPATNVSFENFAVLRASHTASVASQFGIQAGNAGTQIVRNGIVSSWEDDSIAGISSTYIDCHNNGGTCDGGTGQVTYAPRTNGLTYMHKIEDGSSLKTAGLSGGQIGPQNVYKMGTDGTLYGETGWNTLTANALWPWPNQSAIRTALCGAYSHGMCAGSQSLSSYMTFGFEGSVDTSSPTAPGTPSTTTVTTASIGWTWSASTDDVGVSGYRYDLATDSGFSSLVVTNQDNGSATTATTSGLSASTPYYIRVRAYDATGNIGSNSSTGTGTTSAPLSAPRSIIIGAGRSILTGGGTSIKW